MTAPEPTQFDGLESPCRLLGHPVSFHYCRTQADGRPCRQVLNCWFERIPIEDYARRYFGAEEIARLQSPPPSKLLTLVELIEKAKSRQPPS